MKETFEKRLERRMKNWKQEQHEKKIFGDPETEEVEWKIVELEGGGFIRKPFKVYKKEQWKKQVEEWYGLK